MLYLEFARQKKNKKHVDKEQNQACPCNRPAPTPFVVDPKHRKNHYEHENQKYHKFNQKGVFPQPKHHAYKAHKYKKQNYVHQNKA